MLRLPHCASSAADPRPLRLGLLRAAQGSDVRPWRDVARDAGDREEKKKCTISPGTWHVHVKAFSVVVAHAQVFYTRMLHGALLSFSPLGAPPPTLWPVPQEPTTFDGDSLLLSPRFRISATGAGAASPIMVDLVQRYEALIGKVFAKNPCPPASYCQYDATAPCPKDGVCHGHISIPCSCDDAGADDKNACSTCDAAKVQELTISVSSKSATLGAVTDVSYSLSIGAGGATAPGAPRAGDVLAHAGAATVFGALYALETFSQLLSDPASGAMTAALSHSEVVIGKDAPEYAHRALTLDVARRFVPIAALENIVEGMAYSKLSVLHLHLSDEPAMRLEVKAFPELTAGLAAGQWYAQDEMAAFVRFAHARGVRVVPELDVPAHAAGLAPLGVSGAATFCDAPYNTTLAPSASSLAAIATIFGELAALFPDELVHVGGDEACKDGCPGVCTYAGVHAVEAHAQSVLVALGRTPMGWNEIFSSPAGGEPNAAKQPLVLQNWRKGSMSTATRGGFRSVDSNFATMYLAQQCCRVDPPSGKSDRFTPCYHVDVAAEAKGAAERALVLGGEVRGAPPRAARSLRALRSPPPPPPPLPPPSRCTACVRAGGNVGRPVLSLAALQDQRHVGVDVWGGARRRVCGIVQQPRVPQRRRLGGCCVELRRRRPPDRLRCAQQVTHAAQRAPYRARRAELPERLYVRLGRSVRDAVRRSG